MEYFQPIFLAIGKSTRTRTGSPLEQLRYLNPRAKGAQGLDAYQSSGVPNSDAFERRVVAARLPEWISSSLACVALAAATSSG